MNWYKIASKEYEKIKDGEYYLSDWPKQTPAPDNYVASDKWIPVESSFITHVSYYAPLKILEFKFRNGQRYSYSGVPKKVFMQFMKAHSKGDFFNRIIKQRYSQN